MTTGERDIGLRSAAGLAAGGLLLPALAGTFLAPLFVVFAAQAPDAFGTAQRR